LDTIERGTTKIRLTGLALMSFLVGAAHAYRLNVIGEATLDELLLPVLALYALTKPGARQALRTQAFRIVLIALLVTFSGYVVSDLIRESAAEQFLRGWGRVALVAFDFIALALIVGAQRQCLWWFLAGFGIAGSLYFRLVLHAPISLWKFNYSGFGYAEPVTLVALTLAYFMPSRIGALGVGAVGLVSIYYDFRIQSAVCFLVAAVILVRAGKSSGSMQSRGRIGLMVVGFVAAMTIFTAGKLTEDDYSANRRAVSDAGRSFGKVFAWKAIRNSPIIGYGSWSRSPEFLQLQRESAEEVAGGRASRIGIGDSSSATHAMTLQSWVEGGILGTAFFVVLGFMLVRNLVPLILTRPMDALSPLLLYFVFYGMWHIVMSAFAAPLRVQLALSAVCLVCMELDRRQSRHEAQMPVPTTAGKPGLAEAASRRRKHRRRTPRRYDGRLI